MYWKVTNVDFVNFRNEEQFPFQCDDCMKRFESLSKLETHNKTKRKGCYRFQCPHCSNKYCTENKLREHIKAHNVADQEVPGDNANHEAQAVSVDNDDHEMETETVSLVIPDSVSDQIRQDFENLPDLDYMAVGDEEVISLYFPN